MLFSIISTNWNLFFTTQLIMPGYCVSGTVGAKVLSGAKKVEIENRQVIEVKMSVQVSY
jgi:integrator complex subunit 11